MAPEPSRSYAMVSVDAVSLAPVCPFCPSVRRTTPKPPRVLVVGRNIVTFRRFDTKKKESRIYFGRRMSPENEGLCQALHALE